MDVMEKLQRINDICLFVTNFDEAVNFFQKKFEFKLIRLQPNEKNANYAEFCFGGTSLTLWKHDAVASVLGPKYVADIGHRFMIAIKVDTVEDVNLIHKRLVRNGVKCIKEPVDYNFGSRAAYYHDCEENIWEVFAWIKGDDGPGLL